MSTNRRFKKQQPKIEFSKVLCALIAASLFVYAIYAGFAFYAQVSMYYTSINNAIEAGTEYISIAQPDSTLAVTCVTCILASFLTYCLYQFGLKNSLNKNNLNIDNITGIVKRIATNENNTEDALRIKKEELKKDLEKTEQEQEDFQETVAG